MNQRGILHIIFAVLGIPVLITIGVWSATDPLYAGISALIIFGLWVLTQLGARAWLLIPYFAAFGGALNAMPGRFAPRDIVVGLVAMMLPALWVVRRFPIRVRFGGLEMGLLVLLVLLGQAYLRNPTGLLVIRSANIGGRAYFETVVGLVAFVILSSQLTNFKDVRWMVFAFIGGSISAVFYDTLLGVIPAVAVYGAVVYQSSGASSAIMEHLGLGADPNQGAGRRMFLKNWGRPLATFVMAFRSPVELLKPRNWIFLLLIGSGFICVLLSGFRSVVVEMGLIVIAAMFLRRKLMQLFVMGALGIPLIGVVLVLQGSVMELPLAAQRALSFLPADWNERAVRSAEGSSDWRFDMWEEALTSERFIRNKWLGDGFGFTAREMAYQQELILKGLSEADQQEFFLTVGDFHSGPIETIKRIGYIGLMCLLVVMGVFFRTAVRLVNQARGTPYFPYAMFIALPLVVHPVFFVLIFGTFKGTLTYFLFFGGALRLIQNSLEEWKKRRSEAASREVDGGQSRIAPGVGSQRPA